MANESTPSYENEYVGESGVPFVEGDLPGQPNDQFGVDAMDSIEEASNVGTTDDDTEAQTSTPVRYGDTDPTGGATGTTFDGYSDRGNEAFLRGASSAPTRAADVPVGAGGEGSEV